MKRILFLLLLIPSLAWGQISMSGVSLSGCTTGVSAADYCASQSWNTFTAFRLDFDHTTDTKTACLASGTQVGVLTNTPSISTPTPSTTGIGSGGNAFIGDTSDTDVHFDNTASIFASQYGELMLKVNLSGNNTTTLYPFYAVGVAGQDKLAVVIQGTGGVNALWEDHNHTDVTTAAVIDLDSYYGDWVQIHVKWDTTRCSDGTCDGAGEDELCIRARVDANNDGDFGDGGAEDWTAWVCEASAIDLGAFATEPDTDDIHIGLFNTTIDAGITLWVDDVEISTTQPSW